MSCHSGRSAKKERKEGRERNRREIKTGQESDGDGGREVSAQGRKNERRRFARSGEHPSC